MLYSNLVSVYERLESTSKRLEKTFVLSEFLKSADELDVVILLVQGRVFANWDVRELGMADKLVLKAISVASGASLEKIESFWRECGDLGSVAFELVKKKSQVALFSQPLSVRKVFDNLRKIAELSGSGTVDRKVQLVAELLTSASPSEAKFIVRTVLSDLRVGLGDGTIRDSIVWAFFGDKAKVVYDVEKNELVISDDDRLIYDNYVGIVQSALDVANDFGRVIVVAKNQGESGLSDISLSVGVPVKVMLFQKAKGVVDAFEVVGRPAAFEFKYDGFRLQIHKKDGRVKLFTRNLEDVTVQFPDVVSKVLSNVNSNEFIIDCEAVGVDVKSGKFLAFQDVSQRIKRKYDIEDMARKFPVFLAVFDVLFADGKSLLNTEYVDRRVILSGMISSDSSFGLSSQVVTDSDEVASEFYASSLSAGNEGVMAKNLKGTYKPGSRVGFGVKVKPVMDSLEVVIVGAEWGEGKRSDWLASFIVAVRDVDSGEFVEVGRVGTGFKEKVEEGVSFLELTNLLKPLIVENKGREVRVRPEIIIEVDYEEVQKSPTYSSGFALRFPRFIKLRSDRSAIDINTVEDVRALADNQRGRGDSS